MKPNPCLAAAQTTPWAGDVEANLRQHLQLVELAATEQVKLLVFPELSLTGYELASASCQFAICEHMAFKMSRLKDASRRHGLTTIFANYGGPSGGLPSAGGSCVRSNVGEAVVRLPAAGPGLAVAWQDGARWLGKAVLVEALL